MHDAQGSDLIVHWDCNLPLRVYDFFDRWLFVGYSDWIIAPPDYIPKAKLACSQFVGGDMIHMRSEINFFEILEILARVHFL